MSLTLPADAGEPMSSTLTAAAEVRVHKFPASTRQVSLRNVGTNTLWISLDAGTSWFDVACGTSWEDRIHVNEIAYCTQIGTTHFALLGLALL
jgi:hypothetical protein